MILFQPMLKVVSDINRYSGDSERNVRHFGVDFTKMAAISPYIYGDI